MEQTKHKAHSILYSNQGVALIPALIMIVLISYQTAFIYKSGKRLLKLSSINKTILREEHQDRTSQVLRLKKYDDSESISKVVYKESNTPISLLGNTRGYLIAEKEKSEEVDWGSLIGLAKKEPNIFSEDKMEEDKEFEIDVKFSQEVYLASASSIILNDTLKIKSVDKTLNLYIISAKRISLSKLVIPFNSKVKIILHSSSKQVILNELELFTKLCAEDKSLSIYSTSDKTRFYSSTGDEIMTPNCKWTGENLIIYPGFKVVGEI